jgi:ABC-type glycerol-3-phosphate transport system substrate-binding protein
MKHIGFAALALGTAALMLVAKAASPVTIQYATWDATREKADKKVIAAFEKSHPEGCRDDGGRRDL